jgi:formiminoglutamase
MYDLHDFLSPINKAKINDDAAYNDGQLANFITVFDNELPDLDGVDIVLLGVSENRGAGVLNNNNNAADAIRKQLYQLHYWHDEVKIADVGNIKIGATVQDTYAATKTVIAELLRLKKTVVILGGSHDNTLAQYYAYKELQQVVEATCIDALINLRGESPERSENFLMELLTSEPNLVKHYSHIGFQSYLVHPRMLQTMDKLTFDCYRVGAAKENMEEMEPVLRNSHLVSFDISAIKNSDAPCNTQTPNGFTGEEACLLSRYVGMSNSATTFGIYGYVPAQDVHELTAKQIAQMLWYFIDGKNKNKQEANLADAHLFNEYNTVFAEVATLFVQSKKTGRWWMQLPDKKMIACSRKDYLLASQNDIPERWLRAQQRG